MQILRMVQMHAEEENTFQKKVLIAQKAQDVVHLAEWSKKEPEMKDETKGEYHSEQCELRSERCNTCYEEESKILHIHKGCFNAESGKEEKQKYQCECIRTDSQRKQSYRQMIEEWAKDWKKK